MQEQNVGNGVRRLIAISALAGLLILVPAVAVSIGLDESASIEPSEQASRTIKPLGLETHGFRYRAPAGRELAVWLEVYRDGKLVDRASPGFVHYETGGWASGTIRISRVELSALDEDDRRLKLHLEVAGDRLSGMTSRYLPLLDEDHGSGGWHNVGPVPLTDEPRLIWAYAYTSEDGFLPAYRPLGDSPGLDRELVDHANLAIIARAALRTPREKDADTGYSASQSVECLMGKALLERMRAENGQP